MAPIKPVGNGNGEMTASVNVTGLIEQGARTNTLLEMMEKRFDQQGSKLDTLLIELKTATGAIDVLRERVDQLTRDLAGIERVSQDNKAWIDGARTVPERLTEHGKQIDALEAKMAYYAGIAFGLSIGVNILLKVLFHV